MRSLIFGAALLAVASPALAQDYRGYDRPSYDRSDRGDYDRDGDHDRRDRYLAARDVDRDGDYDRRDRYLAGRDRDYRGYSDRAYASGSWIANPYKFGLPRAPRYTHWVRARTDALLVRDRDRKVIRVVRNVL